MFDVLWSFVTSRGSVLNGRPALTVAIAALVAIEASKDAKAKAVLVDFVKESLAKVPSVVEGLSAPVKKTAVPKPKSKAKTSSKKSS